ncbi:sensor histidine kinase [Paenibacillus chitinolyticus]|uniref:histidine kinase n=1 Tax=Paenibacillus chitinolyticus TaxID=79263 RepID=A0A410WZI4_9BACL|nr:sensor histidine kinase [Paenibacillus chitinolyticus]MCY9590256.1 histidine kinase [Paenibacillus chitinolyticus]MCY9596952.1 histidine kinase [Paenibacillus chitinolyticus]QAV19743.1 sensor histidine kinase [Paenibacillus chitinolyticus]
MKKTLSRTIFIYIAVVVIITASSIGWFSYHISSSQLRQQNEQHLIEAVSNAVNHTDLYLKLYERAHLSLFTHPDIRKFLDSPPKDDYAYFQYTDTLKKQVIDPLFLKTPEIMTVYLTDYSKNWVYFVNPALKIIQDPVPGATVEELDKETDSNGNLTIINNSVFTESDTQLITLSRKIHGQVFNEFKGILTIQIKSDEFSTLWKGVNLGPGGFFSIVDHEGRIVHHPDKTRIGKVIGGELLAKLENTQLTSFTDASFGEERMIVSRKSSYSGWNLMVSIPTEDINRPIASIRYLSFLVGGITLLIALLISYRFGRIITKPIHILKRGMRQTEQGNWMKIPQLRTRNEFSELIDRYNLMVASLSELMDTLYKTELSKKDAELERQKAELQSLQLQINPHFLYNTLENIICYAVIRQSEEITEIVDAIAAMFRYSVQTHIEETAIVNELKHVLNYMTIMKHRVGRDFELDVRITPEFFLKKTARLTLQPLIENVFQHAFADGIEDYHYIRLDAWTDEEERDLVIVIEDNGVGIPPEKLASLKRQLESNQLADSALGGRKGHGGIGLMNVHRRIQLVFGEKYGLSISSIQGQGTSISIRFPNIGS